MMLGDNIRKYRELSGYSQSELAGLLGIKKQKKPQKPSIYKDSTAFIIHGRNGARTRD